eukprot:3255793-Prymnesium_polylepis.1
MRVARSEKQAERLEHKLITVCKLGLSNGSALTRTEGRETAFYIQYYLVSPVKGSTVYVG